MIPYLGNDLSTRLGVFDSAKGAAIVRISCQSFSMPKAGRNFADCEDAYYPFDAKNLEIFETTPEYSEIFRCSVSDGATDSIFSRLWAQLLSQGYGSGKWASDVTAESIVEEQNAWHEFLAKQELPWYAEEKAEMGAYAATVGLTLREQSNQWDALAFGDCCIFQVRNDECVTAFPIDNSAGFSNFPLILCSVANRNGDVFESKRVISNATWQSGDKFLLMSDTVSCWLLSQIEIGKGAEVFRAFNAMRNLNDFVTLINTARTTPGADGNVAMKDDDVTVTIVTVADSAAPPFPRKLGLRAASVQQQSAIQPAPPAASKKNTIDLPRIPKPSSNDLQSGSDSKSASSSSTSTTSSTATTKPSPRASLATAATTLEQATSSIDASEDSAYSNDSFIGRRKFAQSTRHKSSNGGRRALVILIGLVVLALGALGFSMIAGQKQNPQPAHKVDPKSGGQDQATNDLSNNGDGSVNDGKHHRKLHKGRRNHQVDAPTSTGAEGASASPGSSRAPVNFPPTAPDRHRVKAKELPSDQLPSQAPDRSASGNSMPLPAPDRIEMPPRAPERMPSHAPDRITHGGRPTGGDVDGNFPHMPALHNGHKNRNRDAAAENLNSQN